jgi:hypothetical protein
LFLLAHAHGASISKYHCFHIQTMNVHNCNIQLSSSVIDVLPAAALW